MLIHIGQAVARRNGNPNDIKYYAQELKENTYNLTRMNLVMRGILPDNIVARNGDTLKSDWPWFDTDETKDETYEPLFVDAVVSNPPYSQNWEPPEAGEDIRFEYGIAPKSKADYAFLLHDLYHLRDDGIMAIVLPHGVLFRGGEEGAIRRNLVENHHIQAIIGLPANIFFGTGIPTIVMVLRKHRNDDHVLVVDASKYFTKEGKNNKLRASDIKRIVDAVTGNRDIDKFSRLVSIDEIRQNDYNLNIPRYVDSSESAESWDVYSTMFGGIPKQDIDALGKYWNVFPGLRQRLFAEENGHSAKLAVQDVREAVNADSGVSAYIQRYREVFTDYPAYLRDELVGNAANVSIAAEEETLTNDLLRRLAGIPLVDAYAAYQVLDDSWQKTISIDLETIQAEGHDAVRKVDANMVVKKKGGKDVEVPDGWVGHILPFDLVQGKFLTSDLAEIATFESRLSEIDNLITLHQRKYDKLVIFKKSMLEKMFPKDGESVPEIRFAGFTDPWEQRKLGELALTYSGGTPSAGNSAYYGGEIPFIRSAEIDCDSTELSLTVAGLNNSSAKLVDKGMVLYAMYGATSGEVAISKIKGAINQAILAMDASDMAANRFIAYWLRRQKKSITETFLQGGQGNLSGAIIKELGIPQPSLDEQRQIGSFFSNLDDLITLHQRKLELLQNIKKSLLDKMFV